MFCYVVVCERRKIVSPNVHAVLFKNKKNLLVYRIPLSGYYCDAYNLLKSVFDFQNNKCCASVTHDVRDIILLRLMCSSFLSVRTVRIYKSNNCSRASERRVNRRKSITVIVRARRWYVFYTRGAGEACTLWSHHHVFRCKYKRVRAKHDYIILLRTL